MGEGDAKFSAIIGRHGSFQDFVHTFPENLRYTRMLHFIPQYRFICNGSGDLMVEKLGKYERLEDDTKDIFDHFHPAVLALIARTTDSAQKAQIPVALCGEMAHDLDATALLVGLGISRLSMDVGSLDTVRHQIRAISKTDANRLAAEALEQPSAADVRALLAASTLTPNLQT